MAAEIDPRLEKPLGDMPSPTPEQRADPRFEAIWSVVKDWDVNAPRFYEGYCGADGSHVALILNALDEVQRPPT